MTAYDWDSTIQHDGGDYKTLPAGIYPFTIKAMERGYYNGGANIPPCPEAKLTLRVGVGPDSTDLTSRLKLDDSLEWVLCQFFLAIGDRKHGEALRMNWDGVVGKTGWVELEVVQGYKDPDKLYNQVKRYIDPQDAPVDGKPIVKSGDDAADEW